MTFYDVMGLQRETLHHVYTKQLREYRRDIPTPIISPDGSLLFYGLYEYGRNPNPADLFLREIFSGGHGKTPAWSNYVEIIPTLIHADSSSLAYLKVTDMQRETVLGVAPEFSLASVPYTTETLTIPPYQVSGYHVTDRSMLFFESRRQLIVLSECGISVSFPQLRSNILAPLPPLVRDFEQLSLNSFALGVTPSVKEIVLARHAPFPGDAHGTTPLLYLLCYDTVSAEWKTTILPLDTIHVGDDSFDFLNVYLLQNDVYVVIGEYSSRVTFLHCELDRLKRGGLLDISDLKKH